MQRIPFSQIIKNAEIDIKREYDRLFNLFYVNNSDGYGNSLYNKCDEAFLEMPFRGTCISLEDFNDFHGCHFEIEPDDFDINYLINFCEYSFNLAFNTQWHGYGFMNQDGSMQFYVQQILAVIEKIGYMANTQDGLTDFVPKDQVAISVAEIVDPTLSYRVIEYNHHSMKGDLEKKKGILLALADKLEPQRGKLSQISSVLASDLFYLLNNISLRHNNTDPTGKDYKPFVAAMSPEELEQWYDDTYQTCLLAFLELDQAERKPRIDQLKKDNQKK